MAVTKINKTPKRTHNSLGVPITQPKKSKAAIGNTRALKTGETKGSRMDNFLKNNGIDFKELAPKMEHFESPLGWNKVSIAYQIKKAEVLKQYMELAYTLGGKALEIQQEIANLSRLLDQMEREFMQNSENPLSSKEYLNALKLKKDYIIEKGKLDLDYGKAATDYAIKKANNPDAFESDDAW